MKAMIQPSSRNQGLFLRGRQDQEKHHQGRATPNDTTSASESNSAPKSEVRPPIRANGHRASRHHGGQDQPDGLGVKRPRGAQQVSRRMLQ